MVPAIRFTVTALFLLAVTFLLGGLPWAIVGLTALYAQAMNNTGVAATLGNLAPSLLWLALFRLTENRELFFPYTMYLAASVALLLAGKNVSSDAVGGLVVVSVFLGVRIFQRATVRVLAIEMVVAASILAVALAAYWLSPRTTASRSAIAAIASVVAYACLSL